MSTLATLVVAALVANGPSLLVSPADLAASFDDPALVVLHVANHDAEFAEGHVPGARFVRYSSIADNGDALGSELPTVETLVTLFESLGVSDASRVIVYGSPIAATRLFFTLDYLGHATVQVLNGGLAGWRAEGRPVETGTTQSGASASPPGTRPRALAAVQLTPHVKADRRAMADFIETHLDEPVQMTLVDARPEDEFTGRTMGGAHAPGHIPGARQLVWSSLVDQSGRFLPDQELRRKLEAAGAKPAVPLVTYCMVGMRASVVYFVARHLGYDARMYDGSMVDWSRRMLPVRTGK
ncbi:MAG: sulfurtransferase [Acidobacteria bacterium]|nr:sulfurtransferase [Acidobacteriota bacterium]